LELVEAALDAVSERVDVAVERDLDLSSAPHRDDRDAAFGLGVLPDAVGIVTFVGDENLGIRRVCVHHEIVAFVVRDFPAGDLCRDREPFGVSAEMNFSREAAFRSAKTLSLSPPYGWPATPLTELLQLSRGAQLGQRRPSMDIAVLGIDLGKNSCSVVGLDASGRVVLRRRLQRKTIVTVAAKLPPCIIAMEACCGAHHLGRVLAAQGHTLRLMSPEYVRPYVKAQKNDDRDAEAIAEAATRPTMRFVTLKSEDQLDMQTLHRVRDRIVAERTSLMNQLRAILLERGIIVPKGRAKLRLRISELILQPCEELSPRIRLLIEDMLTRWQALDDRIAAFDAEFAAEARQNEAGAPPTALPGIGGAHDNAPVAAIGDAQTFGRGRDLAALLGLVPRPATTGGEARVLRTS